MATACCGSVSPGRFQQPAPSNSDGLLANRAFMRAVDAAREQAAQQRAKAERRLQLLRLQLRVAGFAVRVCCSSDRRPRECR